MKIRYTLEINIDKDYLFFLTDSIYEIEQEIKRMHKVYDIPLTRMEIRFGEEELRE